MRRKQDSKRRWIARFRLGRFIPYLVIMQHNIKRRLTPCAFEPNRDGVRRIEE